MMLCNMQIMSAIYIDKPVLLHLFKHIVLLVLHLSNFDDEFLYALKQLFINSEKIYIVLFFFSYWKGLLWKITPFKWQSTITDFTIWKIIIYALSSNINIALNNLITITIIDKSQYKCMYTLL